MEAPLPRRLVCLAGAFACAAAPALADYGVRPVRSEFQPAVSTQYHPPDGGRRYPPPDTKTLIRPQDRQATERAEAELNRKAGQPLPNRSGDPVNAKQPRRMKDPLAIPPASSSEPSTPALPTPAPTIEQPRR